MPRCLISSWDISSNFDCHFIMKNILLFFIGMNLFFLIGCSSSDEIAKNNLAQITRSGSRPIEAEIQADNYVIRQSDTVEISVWGYPEFNTRALVKETGGCHDSPSWRNKCCRFYERSIYSTVKEKAFCLYPR